MKLFSIKKAFLSIATFYSIAFIIALWLEKLSSVFFVKFSITLAVVEILLALYFYFEYWHSDDKKNKKDYFAD